MAQLPLSPSFLGQPEPAQAEAEAQGRVGPAHSLPSPFSAPASDGEDTPADQSFTADDSSAKPRT